MATITLGAEHDRRVVRAARWALRKLGAKRKGWWWGLGGSQDVVHEEWDTKAGIVVVEAETYIGVTISGPDDFIAQAADLVSRKLGRP
jgi:hypothetical protein